MTKTRLDDARCASLLLAMQQIPCARERDEAAPWVGRRRVLVRLA